MEDLLAPVIEQLPAPGPGTYITALIGGLTLGLLIPVDDRHFAKFNMICFAFMVIPNFFEQTMNESWLFHAISVIIGVFIGVSAHYIHQYQASCTILQMSLFMIVLFSFHFLEFMFHVVVHPSKVNLDAFVFVPTGSEKPAYTIAMGCAFLEFWIFDGTWLIQLILEKYDATGQIAIDKTDKAVRYIAIISTAIAVLGLLLRNLAFYQADTNFTHRIAMEKTNEHELITSGIYSLFRHPAYVGWMIWACSTQVILFNPFSFVIFVYTSYVFFAQRIVTEENLLLEFFGKAYEEYAMQVPCGIPFISTLGGEVSKVHAE